MLKCTCVFCVGYICVTNSLRSLKISKNAFLSLKKCVFVQNKLLSHFELEMVCFEREKTHFFREIVRYQSLYYTRKSAKINTKCFLVIFTLKITKFKCY